MARTISVGRQSYEKMISAGNFYVDKTLFIEDWWNNDDEVTLITRPRRFGKTLNMDMLNCFFSNAFAGRSDLFEGLKIWKNEEFRKIQGTYPVIFLSFAEVKNNTFENMKKNISSIFYELYDKFDSVLTDSQKLSDDNKLIFNRIKKQLVTGEDENSVVKSVQLLSKFLSIHYEKKVIILLDEYDTPLIEAYTGGFWDEIISFLRMFFNSTFKTNEYLHRAVMTGITRVSKESLFSDLNNLKVCTLASEDYNRYFGFAEKEVFEAMDEFGYTNKDEVKYWYDGFIIGGMPDIYNPWSVINYLNDGKLKAYWANTSSNGLVSKLLREADEEIKSDFEELLRGEKIVKIIDDEMVFSELGENVNAVWSLLTSAGYLKMSQYDSKRYELAVVNHEVMEMFEKMVSGWFTAKTTRYSRLLRSLLDGNTDDLNEYMNLLTESMFSYFDCADSEDDFYAPEKFYHGFVLGMLVELRDRYAVQSNRESGLGRYDVMLIPKDKNKDKAFIMEFKVVNRNRGEKSLEDALKNARKQIEDNNYEQMLNDMGITSDNIIKYGLAFMGKKVLIG